MERVRKREQGCDLGVRPGGALRKTREGQGQAVKRMSRKPLEEVCACVQGRVGVKRRKLGIDRRKGQGLGGQKNNSVEGDGGGVGCELTLALQKRRGQTVR